MSTYTMSGSENIDINNIDINKLNNMFKAIDFINNKKINNSEDLNVCHECGSSRIIEDYGHGNIVCTDCGQVLEHIYDDNPEWKQFDDDDKNCGRCVAAVNPLLPQSSLGTTIGGFGKTRIKTLHSWNSMPYKERSNNNEYKKIHEVCEKGHILKSVELDAQGMYKIANECRHETGKQKDKFIITRGTNRIGISAGCVFLSCMKNKVTRTSREIAALYGIKDAEMNRGYKHLLYFLKIKGININIGTSKAEHFVKRYCDELQIKNIYITEAIKIAQNVDKLNVGSNHTPYSVAAASILIMAEMFELKAVSKKKIALEFGLSEVTIAKTYKELEIYKHVLSNTEAVISIVNKINKEYEQESISDEVLLRMKKFEVFTETENQPIKCEKTIVIDKLKINFDIGVARQLLEQFKINNKKMFNESPIKIN